MQPYTIQRIQRLFASTATRAQFIQADKTGTIPRAKRFGSGKVKTRYWPLADVAKIGARWGFLERLSVPTCITVFSTKGGVLKTTLGFNIARMAALHDIRTCVVGVDFQGDITTALGYGQPAEDETIEAAIDFFNRTSGLHAFNRGCSQLDDIIVAVDDVPTLSFIPETPDLDLLERELGSRPREEYWLRDQVVRPLKKHFDLIVIDCGPSWNRLITNALVACDMLVSPVECKINQFRNLPIFQDRIEEFNKSMDLAYQHVFVPTLYNPGKRLNADIYSWYQANVPGITRTGIRESIKTEEAVGDFLSVPELHPTQPVADDMRALLAEMWKHLPIIPKDQPTSHVQIELRKAS